jgi:hypothetical protein
MCEQADVMKRRAAGRRPGQLCSKITMNASTTPNLIGAVSQGDGTSRWTNPAHPI